MRTRACALALLITLSPAMFPVGTAFADDALTEMARQRFQEGVKFFDQKKYEEARAAFLQAYALKRHPAVLLNLAQSELRANRPAEAARHFAQYLRENPNSTSLERQEAERGLAEARAKAGRISVSVNAAGADVFVDDEFIGKTPLGEPIDVPVGTHRIEAKLGDQTASATVVAAAGKVVDAHLVLGAAAPAAVPTPAPAAPPPATGPATAPPPPSTYAPPTYFPPPPGSDSGIHVSTSKRKPFIPWVREQPIAWATLGVTAVGAGLGIYGGVTAATAGNKADDLTIQIQQRWAIDSEAQALRPAGNVCAGPLVTSESNFESACAKLRSTLDDEDTGKTFLWAGVIVAGAGVAGTALAYFLTSKETGPAPTAIVTLVYGPDQAGLSLVGTF